MKSCLLSLSLVLVFSGWQVAWSQAQNDEFEALPLTDMQPPQAQPAIAAPAAEPAEPGSEVAPPSADALFELDRSSLFTVEDQSPVPAPSPAAAPRASFWGRLFGKGRAPQPSAPVAAELTAESSADAPEVLLSAEEIVRRQAQEIEGQRILEQADQARDQKDFEEALKLYNQALNLLPVRPPTMDKRNQARSSQAYCEYRIALLHYQQGNWSETKKAINRALGYAPKHRESLRLSERLAREEAQKLVAKPPPIRATPERLNKEKRIREAISRGKQYMDIKEYEKAAYEFNTVIFEDKNNEEANANLRKIAEKGYKLETQQYERMKKEMMTQVRDAWTPALRPEVVAPERAPDATIMVSPGRERLLKKLNTIVIPLMDFRQATIVDVIKYLDQQSIIADHESPPGEKGVNIILNLRRPGHESVAEELSFGEDDDIFGEPAAIRLAPTPAASTPLITLTLRNMVLLDAIKYVTDAADLKYRIEENVVVIMPKDAVVGEVEIRHYRVQPNIGDLVSSAPQSTMGIMGTELRPTGPSVEPSGDIKSFFVNAGVPFPEGTSIQYHPSANLLIVANTAENHDRFEQLLALLNVIPTQVEIEARFVEVGQEDLEELGLRWLLTDDWQIAQDASSSAAVPLSARERIQVNKTDLTKGLRFLDGSSTAIPQPIPDGTMGALLSISSILTNPELTIILHALEQSKGANLLSAPKVTTKSGSNAEIRVAEELIYPGEYTQDTQSVGGGDNELTQIVVTPTDFQTRDVGVILNVTPVVGPDGYTIDLAMLPQVVELADWIDYGTTVTDPGGNVRKLPMRMPIFRARTIATSISIWDGQTVVMGGLITEGQSTSEDKIPFLSDIPLLGRLFRSKTSVSQKRNLLIFVTANLVDPAGNKINKSPVGLAGVGTGAAATP